jgi:serine/threonine protein kinase
MSKLKPAAVPPDTVIGGYRVIRKAGSPADFGVVYLALDNEGQQVAIKEYLPSSLATRPPGELAATGPARESCRCTGLA